MNSLGKLPFNWFDLLVVIVLVAGAFRGRKRGMSQELIPLLKWICIVLVCGLCYAPLAAFVSDMAQFSRLTSAVMAYFGLGLVVSLLFSFVARQLGGKIIGSDAFGRGEYYLGIVAGMMRFACVLLCGLAILNARLYTQQEIEEHNRYVQKNYDNDFFPALFQVQAQVFQGSLSGPVISNNLSMLLIKPTQGESAPLKRKEFNLPM
jgi:uncharacterized membrane protein required for colicin V production